MSRILFLPLCLSLTGCIVTASDLTLDSCDMEWEDDNERLEANWNDPDIEVTHYDYWMNCADHIEEVRAKVRGDTIEVSYVEKGSSDADCECGYNLHYTLSGVRSGTWTIQADGHSTEVLVD